MISIEMNPSDRIVIDPAILVGKPIIRGTRLSVEFVVGLLGDGWAEADVLRSYPNITHEDVAACLRYAGEILRGDTSVDALRSSRPAFQGSGLLARVRSRREDILRRRGLLDSAAILRDAREHGA